MKSVLAITLAGGIAAAFAQRFTPTGWWLDSGQGVVVTSVVLILLAVPIGAAALSGPWQPRSAVWPSALWAGANIGLTVVLFTIGPGTIFPIVLVFGAGISALAVGAGSLIGMLSRAIWRLMTSPSHGAP
jgi:hypothetical protein